MEPTQYSAAQAAASQESARTALLAHLDLLPHPAPSTSIPTGRRCFLIWQALLNHQLRAATDAAERQAAEHMPI